MSTAKSLNIDQSKHQVPTSLQTTKGRGFQEVFLKSTVERLGLQLARWAFDPRLLKLSAKTLLPVEPFICGLSPTITAKVKYAF